MRQPDRLFFTSARITFTWTHHPAALESWSHCNPTLAPRTFYAPFNRTVTPMERAVCATAFPALAAVERSCAAGRSANLARTRDRADAFREQLTAVRDLERTIGR